MLIFIRKIWSLATLPTSLSRPPIKVNSSESRWQLCAVCVFPCCEEENLNSGFWPLSRFLSSRFYSQKASAHWKFIQSKCPIWAFKILAHKDGLNIFFLVEWIVKISLFLNMHKNDLFSRCLDSLWGDPSLPAVAAGPKGPLCRGAVPHLCLSGARIPRCALLQRAVHPRHHHLQPFLQPPGWWEKRSTLHIMYSHLNDHRFYYICTCWGLPLKWSKVPSYNTA